MSSAPSSLEALEDLLFRVRELIIAGCLRRDAVTDLARLAVLVLPGFHACVDASPGKGRGGKKPPRARHRPKPSEQSPVGPLIPAFLGDVLQELLEGRVLLLQLGKLAPRRVLEGP